MQLSETDQNKQRLWTHTLAPNNSSRALRLAAQHSGHYLCALGIQAAAHKGPQPSKPACNNSPDREDARDFARQV